MKPSFLLLPILFLSFFQLQAQTKIIGFKSHSGSMASFNPASAPGDYGLDERMIEEYRRQDSIRQAQIRLDSLKEEAKQDSLRRKAELQKKAEYEAAQKAAAEKRKKEEQKYKQEKQRLEAEADRKGKEKAKLFQAPKSETPTKTDPSPTGDNLPHKGQTSPLFFLLLAPIIFWMSKKLG